MGKRGALMKHNVLGIQIDETDYDDATSRILSAARAGKGYSVSALAVHGVMTGVQDAAHRRRLNSFDMITPDGQPVRWAMRLLHGVRLPDRVYGPTLTLHVLAAAAEQGVPVFFYGSRPEVLEHLVRNVEQRFPGIVIAGHEPSKFRTITREEKLEIAQRINESGAKILFAGLGCPRQEVFAYEFRDVVNMPILAVGAAFDYHAGLVNEPPNWVQRAGLQWFYRLVQQPRRLWRRYLLLNPAFLTLLGLQAVGLWAPRDEVAAATQHATDEVIFG
jgi:N-acetylglucosaminyldiphosphoundecaprenol N-acetyl-beta-D-mannosaminyltransferase